MRAEQSSYRVATGCCMFLFQQLSNLTMALCSPTSPHPAVRVRRACKLLCLPFPYRRIHMPNPQCRRLCIGVGMRAMRLVGVTGEENKPRSTHKILNQTTLDIIIIIILGPVHFQADAILPESKKTAPSSCSGGQSNLTRRREISYTSQSADLEVIGGACATRRRFSRPKREVGRAKCQSLAALSCTTLSTDGLREM
jgi:hypothetical protein